VRLRQRDMRLSDQGFSRSGTRIVGNRRRQLDREPEWWIEPRPPMYVHQDQKEQVIYQQSEPAPLFCVRSFTGPGRAATPASLPPRLKAGTSQIDKKSRKTAISVESCNMQSNSGKWYSHKRHASINDTSFRLPTLVQMLPETRR
jgi:hypothetical protein